MNSQRLRQLLAVLILLALLGGLLGLILLPLLERWRGDEERIASLRQRLDTYARVAANLPQQQARLAQLRQSDPLQGLVLAQSRPALAAAELQQQVSQLITQSGGQVVSTQILSREAAEAVLPSVGLKVHMRGETEQLVRVLHGLAYSRPLLLVDNLLVLSNPRLDMQRVYRGNEREVLPALDVNFEVLAFMPGKEKP